MEERLIDLVREMRSLQRQYFRKRSYELLVQCKEAEKRVDEWIKRFTGKGGPEQGRLL